MIRATTPKHIFIFDTDPSAFSRILITYAQHGNIVMEKEKDDLTIEQNDDGSFSAWFRLTQEETRGFKVSGGSVQIQVRVLTTADEALASEIRNVRVTDVLNDEVLV